MVPWIFISQYLTSLDALNLLTKIYNLISQVLASKTKIYMVLEYVNGGELFDKIVSTITFGPLE